MVAATIGDIIMKMIIMAIIMIIIMIIIIIMCILFQLALRTSWIIYTGVDYILYRSTYYKHINIKPKRAWSVVLYRHRRVRK